MTPARALAYVEKQLAMVHGCRIVPDRDADDPPLPQGCWTPALVHDLLRRSLRDLFLMGAKDEVIEEIGRWGARQVDQMLAEAGAEAPPPKPRAPARERAIAIFSAVNGCHPNACGISVVPRSDTLWEVRIRATAGPPRTEAAIGPTEDAALDALVELLRDQAQSAIGYYEACLWSVRQALED